LSSARDLTWTTRARPDPTVFRTALRRDRGFLVTPSGARWQERKLLSRVGDSREWASEERARYPGLLPPPSGGRGIPASLTSNSLPRKTRWRRRAVAVSAF